MINLSSIERIHDSSLHILKNVGVVFHNNRAIEIFKKAGARVDGSKVFLEKELIEKALNTCPGQINIKTRSSKLDVCLGTEKKFCAPITGAICVSDIENGRRAAMSEDYIKFAKLAQVSDMFQIVGGPMVIPQDMAEEIHTPFIMTCILSLTDKVVLGQAANRKSARESIKIARLVFGDTKDCFMFGMTNVITPLVYDNDSIEAIFEYVNEGQPIAIACCGIAGVTAPVTLSGMLAVNNAEVLAGVVLTQLISPGTPVIYGNTSVAGDMRTMGLASGAAESALSTGAASQLAKYYNLPCRAGGNLTNAMSCDIQAGYESMMSLLSAMMSDAHIIAQSAGMLESFITASYEKFIADEEIYNMCKRYVEGIEINDNTLALEATAEVGPGGNYLASMHTFENYKTELIRPLISNRDSYDNWAITNKDRLQAACEIYKRRLHEYQVPECVGDIKPVFEYWRQHYGEIPSCLRTAADIGR